jgi:prevent-host-death family protein
MQKLSHFTFWPSNTTTDQDFTFERLVDQSQKGAVTIKSKGRPVAVMISAQSYDAALERFFAGRLPAWDKARDSVLAGGGVSSEDILKSLT